MNVQHVDRQRQQPNRLKHRPTKEHESLAVVFIFLAAFIIDAVAIVIGVLLNEIDRNVAARQMASQYPTGDGFASDRDA